MALNRSEIEKKLKQFEKEHENEVPVKWMRSGAGFFATPVFFLLISILYISMGQLTVQASIILISIILFIIAYRYVLFHNQKLLIYSDRIVYQWGFFEVKTKEMLFRNDDVRKLYSEDSVSIFSKFFSFSNFVIYDKNDVKFVMNPIHKPDDLMNLITMTVTEFMQYFDPDFQPDGRVHIDRNGERTSL